MTRERETGGRFFTLRRSLVLVALSAFGFVLALWLVRSLRRELPSGSDVLPFNASIWRDGESSSSAPDGISQRQKMLGSLVHLLTPELDRTELEQMLGPSLETPYFKRTGRDMIYVLGWERDRYIRLDSEWLLIWLDERGHFRRYQIATD